MSEEAAEFARGMRGQFIIGQALCLAIDKLNEEQEAMREQSNISDMEYLRDNLFPMFAGVRQARKVAPDIVEHPNLKGEARDMMRGFPEGTMSDKDGDNTPLPPLSSE